MISKSFRRGPCETQGATFAFDWGIYVFFLWAFIFTAGFMCFFWRLTPSGQNPLLSRFPGRPRVAFGVKGSTLEPPGRAFDTSESTPGVAFGHPRLNFTGPSQEGELQCRGRGRVNPPPLTRISAILERRRNTKAEYEVVPLTLNHPTPWRGWWD